VIKKTPWRAVTNRVRSIALPENPAGAALYTTTGNTKQMIFRQ
jgi:hypothetical protein